MISCKIVKTDHAHIHVNSLSRFTILAKNQFIVIMWTNKFPVTNDIDYYSD